MVHTEWLIALIEEERRALAEHRLLAYWLRTEGDRNQISDEVLRHRGCAPIVPLVLRKRELFRNPNAVSADFVSLLETQRPLVEALHGQENRFPAVFIIISRTGLEIGNIASPVPIPDWVPYVGSREEMVRFRLPERDLTAGLADTHLDGERKRAASLLYELERALAARLVERWECDRRPVDALLENLKGGDGSKHDDWLRRCDTTLASVHEPSEYRIAVAGRTTVAARIVVTSSSVSADDLGRHAVRLTTALGVTTNAEDARDGESLVSVLARSHNKEDDSDKRYGRNVIAVIAATHLLLTASYHAKDYARYPAEFLQAMWSEVIRSLEGVLDGLS